MGACKTRSVNTGAKYFFNEIHDTINGGGHIGAIADINAVMEQRVSLICSLKNLDSNNNFKVGLIIYSDTKRKASQLGGFTEDKSKDTSNVIKQKNFGIILILRNFLLFLIFLKSSNY